MNSTKWRQIEELYHAALQRDSTERADFLRAACAGDGALLREVQALLAQPVSEAGFLATIRIAAGRRMGPYEIHEMIGRGGMGEVYRARDTKLGRDVAMKVLPPTFTHDADRLSRFQREARLLATLNHPHIAAIYGFEDSSDVHALVLELVDGETLTDRLEKGSLPIAEALEIAFQIADALTAAHDHGIIHRDLKPANIQITSDGNVKVLDFGLAKAMAATDTAATSGETHDGIILGTPTYMSPEQARGQTVDKRTDIWAFGCVLYEMVTGRRAFAGDDVPDIVAQVLTQEPDWNALPPRTPSVIVKLLHRCLAKDRRYRLADASDVRLEIHEARQALSERGSEEPTQSGGFNIPVIVAGIIAGLVAGGAATYWMTSAKQTAPTNASTPVGPLTRTTVELPASAPLVALGSQIPANGWNRPVLALSPDGFRLAYVGWRGTDTILFLRNLSDTAIEAVIGTEGAIYAFFSPDGQWLGFLTNDKVKKVSLNGGAPITLCDATNPVEAWWHQTDVIYFSDNEGYRVSRVSARGGNAERFTGSGDMPEGFRRRFSDVMPDGKSLLTSFWPGISADYADVQLFTPETKKTQVLIRSGYGARYVPPGYIVFARAGSIFAVRYDAARGEIRGDAVPLVTNASMESIWGLVHAAVSRAGLLAYVPGGDLSAGKLAWVSRTGSTDFLEVPQEVYSGMRLAPSGELLAVAAADVTDYVWIYDLQRREGRRLPGTENGDMPAWSPDSRTVAFRSSKPGMPPQILSQTVDGGGTPTEIFSGNDLRGFVGWSPDGRTLGLSLEAGRIQFTSTAPKTEHAIAKTNANSLLWNFSPDGKWIAATSTQTGQFEIWVRSHPDGKIVRQISVDGGVEPVWCRCGEIFYRKGNRWSSTRISTTPELRWDSPRPVFATDFIDSLGTSYDVSADGQRLLISKHTDLPSGTRLHIVTNWFAALRQ